MDKSKDIFKENIKLLYYILIIINTIQIIIIIFDKEFNCAFC